MARSNLPTEGLDAGTLDHEEHEVVKSPRTAQLPTHTWDRQRTGLLNIDPGLFRVWSREQQTDMINIMLVIVGHFRAAG